MNGKQSSYGCERATLAGVDRDPAPQIISDVIGVNRLEIISKQHILALDEIDLPIRRETFQRFARQCFCLRTVSADKDERRAELRERLMRYRILKRETTDPIAIGFLHDIVSELEGDLDGMDEDLPSPVPSRLVG